MRLVEFRDGQARKVTVTDVIDGDVVVTVDGVEVDRRRLNDAEIAAYTHDRNRSTIESQAEAALAANRTYLALSSPTNAQNLAQIRALTRQTQGLIRLLLGQLDGTD